MFALLAFLLVGAAAAQTSPMSIIETVEFPQPVQVYTFVIVPHCLGIRLPQTTIALGPNNANAVIGAITVVNNPPGSVTSRKITLGGVDANSFALSNGGNLPTNLMVGSKNLGANNYHITLDCT